MKYLKTVASIGLWSCFALVATSQTIPNASFEADSFQNGMGFASQNGGGITGWVLSDPSQCGLNLGGTNSTVLFVDNGAIPDGTNVAFIQAANETNSISTTISGLVPGVSYQVTFRANQRASFDAPDASWSLNGEAFAPFTAAPAVGDLNPYYTNSATFTATNTTAALVVQNGNIGGDSALLVDNFTIQTLPSGLWSVYTNSDSGPGSLRQAMLDSADFGGTNIITFDPALSGQTIRLMSQLLVTNIVTIDASALPGGMQLDGSGTNRIFYITNGAFATLKSLTLTNGFGQADGGGGGAIYCPGRVDLFGCKFLSNLALTPGYSGGGIFSFHGEVHLTDCTFTGNSASNAGGAIHNSLGTLTVSNCTFSLNSANYSGAIENDGSLLASQSTFFENNSGDGGAIINLRNTIATATLDYCTLVSNHCNGTDPLFQGGGAIDNYGDLTLVGCIVAGNTATPQGPDIWMEGSSLLVTNSLIGDGSTTALMNGENGNLVGTAGAPINARLGTLANNDGPTPTLLPLPGSPAIDAGGTTTLTSDQRGFPRVFGDAVDIGAVELQTASPVVSTADSGAGSLRYAVTYNPPGGIITFDPALSSQTILLTNGEIAVSSNAVIDASALPGGIVLNGNHSSRIFQIHTNAAVVLHSLTLSNGFAGGDAPDNFGGGIFNDAGATLTLTNCLLTSNSATWAGGIENEGTLNIYRCVFLGNTATNGGGAIGNQFSQSTLQAENSTFFGNSASLYGGAVYNQGSTSSIIHCTISGNSSPGEGGGLENVSNSFVFATNTIVAGNTANTGSDINTESGSSFDGSNNLTNGSPLLAALGNYGGRTQTLPPLPGSPAIDAGFATTLDTDQRGFPRPRGAGPDLGAVEGVFNPAGPGKFTGVKKLGNGAIQFSFTNYSGVTHSVVTSTNLRAPMNTWTNIGLAVESPAGSGQFQFTDPQATNSSRRFYRVKTP